jgi:glycosyltransferase involved in cell wall biosynthesis
LKVIWVKSGGLVPLDHGGRIRSYQIAKELARRNEVTLFTFYAKEPVDHHPELKSIFTKVIGIPLEIAPAKSSGDYLHYAANLFSSRPYSAAKYCRKEVADRLRQHLNEIRYDAIICDFLLTADVIPWDLPGPRVLFTHNIEAIIWQRHWQVSTNPIWKAVAYREYKMMEQMERKYVQRAEHVLAVSETDRSFFTKYADPGKITVIPTGVDVDYFRPQPGEEEADTLLFTGSMDWLANEDGILYFVDQVLPRVREKVPKASLWIVGRRPSQRLRDLPSRVADVHVTGTVDDIRPYMGKGSVYVVPLLVGGGTRIKIFEAMAGGKAVVSTSIGAEGLPVQHGENILLADDPESFARDVVDLLQNSGKREAIGKAARQLVEEHYSWTSVSQVLERVLRQLSERTATLNA